MKRRYKRESRYGRCARVRSVSPRGLVTDPYGIVYKLARKKLGVDRVLFEIGNPVGLKNYWTWTSTSLLNALIPD